MLPQADLMTELKAAGTGFKPPVSTAAAAAQVRLLNPSTKGYMTMFRPPEYLSSGSRVSKSPQGTVIL